MKKLLNIVFAVLFLFISCETDKTTTIIDSSLDPIYFEEEGIENLESNTDPIEIQLNSIKGAGSSVITLGGTAVRDNDYTISDEDINVTFADGIYTTTISVALIDNKVTDGERTIILSLPEGEGLGINNRREYSITILDDDEPFGTVIAAIDGETEEEQDDVEEAITGTIPGRIDDGSSDLEFGEIESSRQGVQAIGLRFNSLLIPQGVTIESAFIQFQVDETRDNPLPVVYEIYAEATDSSTRFDDDVNFSVTSRPRTTAVVLWDIPVWTTVGDRGPDQRTVDISALIKEVIDRPGWKATNSIGFIFIPTAETLLNPEESGRVAEDGDDPDQAAVLTVNWVR